MHYTTEQERFWAGSAGDEYIKRNIDPKILASDIAFFSTVLKRTSGICFVIEFGANVGLNLMAIKQLMPHVALSAVEINKKAVEQLKEWGGCCSVSEASILDDISGRFDLVLSKGLLIHINPDSLKTAYSRLYEASANYILISEYYNPTPVMVEYRGQKDKLFKRDFAGEMMDIYSDLILIDYGFVYHRDPNFRQDDATWFLMQKR